MIPQFEEIRIQALKELSVGIVMRAKDLRIPLAKHFGLTDEEMNAWYPSGNGEIFLDRISWALSYLFIAGLVEKPQRGEVVAVGLGNMNDKGEREPMDVKVGDTILYAKYSGTDVKVDGTEYKILSIKDALAIIE